jgi:predicted metalloprotease with PDZ domain
MLTLAALTLCFAAQSSGATLSVGFVSPSSPADKAGVKVGWKVLTVQGRRPTSPMEFDAYDDNRLPNEPLAVTFATGLGTKTVRLSGTSGICTELPVDAPTRDLVRSAWTFEADPHFMRM